MMSMSIYHPAKAHAHPTWTFWALPFFGRWVRRHFRDELLPGTMFEGHLYHHAPAQNDTKCCQCEFRWITIATNIYQLKRHESTPILHDRAGLVQFVRKKDITHFKKLDLQVSMHPLCGWEILWRMKTCWMWLCGKIVLQSSGVACQFSAIFGHQTLGVPWRFSSVISRESG